MFDLKFNQNFFLQLELFSNFSNLEPCVECFKKISQEKLKIQKEHKIKRQQLIDLLHQEEQGKQTLIKKLNLKFFD